MTEPKAVGKDISTGVVQDTAVVADYYDPCQALYFANARPGKGMRAAMDWLIPLAKQQQMIAIVGMTVYLEHACEEKPRLSRN